ncbi:MAG: acyltransferase [Yonghaparkia sp.]|nr:acyltransferase [Microcella sp.]
MGDPRFGHAAPATEGRDAHRNNNFDAVRLAAALAVIVGHAWPLHGIPDPPSIAGIAIFHLGVYVFFSVSGYLIAQSWMRSTSPRAFLARRAARIFPALIVVVVISIALIGPLATDLPVREYFSSPTTWGYLQNLTLAATYELPGVFEGHWRPVVNGSLWTLGPEFVCYLLLLALALIAARVAPGRSAPVTIVALTVVALALVSMSLAPGWLSGGARPVAEAMVFFMIGAVVALAGRAPVVSLGAPVAIIFWLIGYAVAPDTPIVWAWLFLPVVVIGLGRLSTPVLRRAGRFGDISYGMYLWGFPVQQLVIAWAPGLSVAGSLSVALGVTMLLAFLSWHLVERPSLRAVRQWSSSVEAARPRAVGPSVGSP